MTILHHPSPFVQRLFTTGALAAALLTPLPALAQEPFTPMPAKLARVPAIVAPTPAGYRLWQRPSVVTCLDTQCTEASGPYVPYSRYATAEDCTTALQDVQTLLRDAGSIAGVTPETVLYTTSLLCLPEAITPMLPAGGCPVVELPPVQPLPVLVDAVPTGQ